MDNRVRPIPESILKLSYQVKRTKRIITAINDLITLLRLEDNNELTEQQEQTDLHNLIQRLLQKLINYKELFDNQFYSYMATIHMECMMKNYDFDSLFD